MVNSNSRSGCHFTYIGDGAIKHQQATVLDCGRDVIMSWTADTVPAAEG